MGDEKMRKSIYLLFVLSLAALLQAAPGDIFKLDFDGSLWGNAGETEPGYEAYTCEQENAGSFGPRSYSAFGATITVEPTWAAGAPAAAMQAINREPVGGYPFEWTGDHLDLVKEWIGTDTRENPSEPLTLIISGLPAGTYSLLSYHNDLDNQAGVFNVTVNDAHGSVTYTDFNITSNAATLDGVGRCELTFTARSGRPVALDFDLQTGMFFLMNGFELTQLSGSALAVSPDPSNRAMVDLATLASLSWQDRADPNVVSIDRYDLVFGTEPNMLLNPVYENVTVPFDLAGNGVTLDYATGYYWRVDSHVVWDSNEITGSLQDVSMGDTWYFETLPQDKAPIVTAGSDVLTSIGYLPATLTGTVNDWGEGDVQSVTWEVLPYAPETAMQMITRNDAAAAESLAQITTDPSLLVDWIGTDIRDDNVTGNPMYLVLKGLPAGTYAWKSYHHDAAGQRGVFDATVNDASGSVVTSGLRISDANSLPVTTLDTTIASNGIDDVVLVFEQQAGDYWTESFFVMNGFELTAAGGSLSIDFGNVGVAPMDGYQAYEAQHEAASSFTEQSYSAFGTTVSVLPMWGLPTTATVTDTTNEVSSAAQSAILETVWPGTYVVRLTAADNSWVASDTVTVQVAADACAQAQADPAWAGFNGYDADEDCDVDLADFAAFARQWLEDRNLAGQIQIVP